MKRLLCAVTVGLGLAWLPEQGRAGEAPFVIGGVTLTLAEAGNDVEIFYQAVRLNRALNAWNVEVWVTNKSARPLEGPLVLRVESFSGTTGPVQPDGLDGRARAYYDLSAMAPQGMLLPGQKSAPRTLTLGMGEGTPSLNAQLFVKPASVLAPAALVRSLNEVGQPLPGVQVIDLTEGSTNSTDSTFGVASIGGGAGEHVWKFVAPGFVPVWRQQTLATGEVAVVLSPRLTPQAPTAVTLTPLGGGQVQDVTRSLQLQFPPGAFSQETRARVTALTAQTLPALLPQGWSPLQAFWLELANEPAIAGSATLHPWGPLGSGETAALTKWNETNLRWEVLQLLVGIAFIFLSA